MGLGSSVQILVMNQHRLAELARSVVAKCPFALIAVLRDDIAVDVCRIMTLRARAIRSVVPHYRYELFRTGLYQALAKHRYRPKRAFCLRTGNNSDADIRDLKASWPPRRARRRSCSSEGGPRLQASPVRGGGISCDGRTAPARRRFSVEPTNFVERFPNHMYIQSYVLTGFGVASLR